ncbi:MAG: hypothetical protein KUG69_04380 [Marinosulfonomonas sp.]|nr:hypothetical protein [Marinosulfonomonas sp.]
MDSDKCGSGIAALSALSDSEIHPLSPPRRLMGKCGAQSVVVKNLRAGVTLEIEQIEWQSGALKRLADGQLPEHLKISVRGVSVRKAPANDPIWSFLKAQGALAAGIDGELSLSYSQNDNVLDLSRVSLDFAGNNSLSASARFHGVRPDFMTKPELKIMTVFADQMVLNVTGGGGFGESLVSAVLKRYSIDMSTDKLKKFARKYVSEADLPPISAQDRSDLQRFITRLPRPSGKLSVGFRSDTGLSAVRAAAFGAGAKNVWPDDGMEAFFHYGRTGN